MLPSSIFLYLIKNINNDFTHNELCDIISSGDEVHLNITP